MSLLNGWSDRFVEAWFRFHPHRATEKGYPGLNLQAPDYSRPEVDQFVSKLSRLRAEIDELKLSQLPAQERLDVRLLQSHVVAALRPFLDGHELESSPTFYLQAGLDSIESLQLRFQKPPWEELRSRLEGIERLLRVAESQLIRLSGPSRDVAVEMAETAIEEFGESFNLTPAAEASDRARFALHRFHDWLERAPADDFAPMGETMFDRLLESEHLLRRDSAEWEALARRALLELEAQLEPVPRVSSEPDDWDWSRQDVWEHFEEELERVRRFVVQADIVTIPRGELRLSQTPAYLQALIPGAFYLEPAVFAGERLGRFYLPRMPEEWTPEVQKRYAYRRRRGGFANLVVHEAWPGHHVQFLHAAEYHHPLRNVRDNDVMLEGWALYCESLMERLGLHPARPFRPRLESLKMRLLRVLVDVGIHTGKMTLSEAEQFMGRELGAVGSPWVAAEIRRYALEPGQAMSYWVGATLIEELHQELEVTHDTEKRFHDQLLGHGPIPLPLIRESMLTQHS